MLKRSMTMLLVSVIFLSLSAAPTFAQKSMTTSGTHGNKRLVNVAHRGASGHAPENTMAAFWQGFKMRADYIEIDVQMTKDGRLVVIHDTTVNRTTNGKGKVADMTFNEIRALNAGSWYGEEFASEKVPSFEEVLDTFRGKIGILIELKSPELYNGVEEKVADALKQRNLHRNPNQRIIVQSFNHASVQKSKVLLPNVPHGVLAGMTWKNITDEQLKHFATYADYFNPNMNLLTHDLVDRIHTADMNTWPYTVRTQEQADRLFNLGVDGIISDYPEYVRTQKIHSQSR